MSDRDLQTPEKFRRSVDSAIRREELDAAELAAEATGVLRVAVSRAMGAGESRLVVDTTVNNATLHEWRPIIYTNVPWEVPFRCIADELLELGFEVRCRTGLGVVGPVASLEWREPDGSRGFIGHWLDRLCGWEATS